MFHATQTDNDTLAPSIAAPAFPSAFPSAFPPAFRTHAGVQVGVRFGVRGGVRIGASAWQDGAGRAERIPERILGKTPSRITGRIQGRIFGKIPGRVTGRIFGKNHTSGCNRQPVARSFSLYSGGCRALSSVLGNARPRHQQGVHSLAKGLSGISGPYRHVNADDRNRRRRRCLGRYRQRFDPRGQKKSWQG